jgi:curved DNA-binding protein CbpA
MSDTIAFHYLLVVLGFTFFSFVAYGFASNAKDLIDTLKSVALRVLPTFGNPLAYARVTYVVPAYAPLSLRVVKRFWINYGFKIVFMIGFTCYAWNVYSESLADDPFTIVGVSPSATKGQVRKACRKASGALHPDKHPGKEEEIRPKFEKVTKACKVLNDDKLRERYVKFGALPRNDKETGGEGIVGSSSGPSLLSVGGGSIILSACFYFLLFVGTPSLCVYYLLESFYDEEQLLAKVVSDCKSLSNDMTKLYEGAHFSSMFLDIGELYLVVAQAEFAEAKDTCQKLYPKGAGSLNALLNNHVKRFNMWKDGNNIKKEEAEEYKKQCARVDKVIADAAANIDSVAKKGKGSSKTK